MYTQFKNPRTYIFLIANIAQFYTLKAGGDTILLGAAGVAVSFLVFCSGLFLSLLGKVIAILVSLLLLVPHPL